MTFMLDGFDTDRFVAATLAEAVAQLRAIQQLKKKGR